jgi:hypothetical protein
VEQLDLAIENFEIPSLLEVQKRSRLRRTRMVLATAGTAAVIVAVALLLPRTADLPIADETPTTTPPASTTTTPASTTTAAIDEATVFDLIARQWTSHKLGDDPLAVIGVASASYIDSEGFFIAGSHWTRGNNFFRGRLWRSAAGNDWGVVPGSGTVFPEGVALVEVIGGEQGLVTWGGGTTVDPSTTVWVSQDGSNWTLSAQVAAPEPLHGLVLESGGYLLYGGGFYEVPEGFTGTLEVLLSADAVTWEVIPAPVPFTAIVQLESGQLIATGGWTSEPTTWTSTDGRAWTLLSADHSITQGTGVVVNALVAAGPGLVAGGTNAEGEAAFWVSIDGRVFEPVASFGPKGAQGGWPDLEEPPTVRAIAAGSEWLVAVGHHGHGGDAVWISKDGVAWDPVPIELLDRSAVSFDHVTYGDSTFVAIGFYGEEALVLTWTPSSP